MDAMYCHACDRKLKHEGDFLCKECDSKYCMCMNCGGAVLIKESFGSDLIGYVCKSCKKEKNNVKKLNKNNGKNTI